MLGLLIVMVVNDFLITQGKAYGGLQSSATIRASWVTFRYEQVWIGVASGRSLVLCGTRGEGDGASCIKATFCRSRCSVRFAQVPLWSL